MKINKSGKAFRFKKKWFEFFLKISILLPQVYYEEIILQGI